MEGLRWLVQQGLQPATYGEPRIAIVVDGMVYNVVDVLNTIGKVLEELKEQ